MKTIQLIVLLFVAATIQLSGQTATEIEKAAKGCKPVFLAVYNTKGADTDKAFAIADEAQKKLKGISVVIRLNTSDAASKALVTKYRLAGTPLPVILVLDKNGSVAGGLALKDATAAKLAEMIPTPKTSELLKAMEEGKSLYVVAYKASMTHQKNVMENCGMACSKLDNKSITVKVDMDDNREAKLLQTLSCDLNAKEPVIFVINKTGQVVATHNGLTDVNVLLSSMKKAPASSCCPGGAPPGGCK